MKRFTGTILFALTAVALLLLTACGMEERAHNRQGVANLNKGMTKQEVTSLLGQPLTDEVYNEPDVWFYYTECRWSDGAITRDECTPVVFENDRVVGWGHDFLKRYRHENW